MRLLPLFLPLGLALSTAAAAEAVMPLTEADLLLADCGTYLFQSRNPAPEDVYFVVDLDGRVRLRTEAGLQQYAKAGQVFKRKQAERYTQGDTITLTYRLPAAALTLRFTLKDACSNAPDEKPCIGAFFDAKATFKPKHGKPQVLELGGYEGCRVSDPFEQAGG